MAATLPTEPSESKILVFTLESRCDDNGKSTIEEAEGSIHEPSFCENLASIPEEKKFYNELSSTTELPHPIPGTPIPCLSSPPPSLSNLQLHSSASSSADGQPV